DRCVRVREVASLLLLRKARHRAGTRSSAREFPMSSDRNLTGRWTGTYFQHDRPYPITAELVHVNQELSGSMCDDEPDTVTSVFEFAAQAGLPPGGDEQLVARLREMFPEAPEAPIRYVMHLPPESTLKGWVRGSSVYFLKNYRGDHVGGFEVGDKIVGHRIPG